MKLPSGKAAILSNHSYYYGLFINSRAIKDSVSLYLTITEYSIQNLTILT
nr:MAG TPA: hypothetical protein [Caudoviricetes sp.]